MNGKRILKFAVPVVLATVGTGCPAASAEAATVPADAGCPAAGRACHMP